MIYLKSFDPLPSSFLLRFAYEEKLKMGVTYMDFNDNWLNVKRKGFLELITQSAIIQVVIPIDMKITV